MKHKYRIDLSNIISEVLLQSESDCSYSKLYEKVKTKLGYQLSHRDYAHCLKMMKNDSLIDNYHSGKRGAYYLTENAKAQHRLVILVHNEDYREKRRLYQILLNFCAFVPGFTKEEFTAYVRDVSKLKESRPISRSPPLPPYIHYTDYTDAEIEEAIESIYQARIVKILPSVFAGETRFYISDNWLASYIEIVRLVQQILVHNIAAKILYIDKPDWHDKQILEFFFEKRVKDLAIAKAHQLRKDFKNKPDGRMEIQRIKKEYRNSIITGIF